jgi:hypothetical protein
MKFWYIVKKIPTIKTATIRIHPQVWKLSKTETTIRNPDYCISSVVRGKSLTNYFEVNDFITRGYNDL